MMIQHDFTGDTITDVKSLLCLHGKNKRTFDHAKAVAEMNIKIANQYGLDATICELGGYLHDISAVVSPSDMLSYAIDNEWYVDEAENKHPFLLHQRISKIISQKYFNITDERILSAVEYHTTLKSNPTAYEMALFIADKLAWDGDSEAPFYFVVNDALKQSLEAASLAYMDYIVENNIILHPHKWFEEGRAFLRVRLESHERIIHEPIF